MKRQILLVRLLLWLKNKCLSKKRSDRIFKSIYTKSYRMLNIILGIDIPYNVKIGENFTIHHPIGIIINPDTVIGNNCEIRQNTTIGNKGFKGSDNNSPIIGNNVNIGANSVIIGPITIGDNIIIGAGSVVTKSFEGNCIIAGNPAKIIKNIIF